MRVFDDSNLIETHLSSEKVFSGLILNVEHAQYRLPNGSVAMREIVRHIGAAGVLPIDKEQNVYLVRQYRTPFDRVLLEIPAGKLDRSDEDKKEAAMRELSEETGMQAAKWTHLDDIYTTVGFCNECIGLYLAEDLSQGETHPDEDEFVNVVKMPLTEAIDMVLHNEIHDTKTVIALLMAERRLYAAK